MKALALIAVILAGSVLVYVAADLSPRGSLDAPPNTHLSPYYLNNVMQDTSVPNVVTAVLADYRGFDTMLETSVIVIAGMAIMLILRQSPRVRKKARQRQPQRPDGHSRDVIIRTACRVLLPFNALFALYVLAHGHHSPGGGFQGGVILGASLILVAICYNLNTVQKQINTQFNIALNNIGVLVFVGTGTLCLLLGGNMLDYAALDPLLPGSAVDARSHCMLIVETGVAIACMSVMYSLYADLSSRGHLDEGL